MTQPDPRSPWVLDTRELHRRAGSMVEVSRTVTLPEPLGTEVIAVPAGSPVELSVRLESVDEGVLVSGTADATAFGACVRCLEPASNEVRATFQELFAYADRAAHHREVADAEDDDDEYELVDDLVDLEPVLRDAVVTALPFQPLCREDCPGLCPQCGALLADDPAHRHDVLDPRWAALGSFEPQPSDTTAELTDDERN